MSNEKNTVYVEFIEVNKISIGGHVYEGSFGFDIYDKFFSEQYLGFNDLNELEPYISSAEHFIGHLRSIGQAPLFPITRDLAETASYFATAIEEAGGYYVNTSGAPVWYPLAKAGVI